MNKENELKNKLDKEEEKRKRYLLEEDYKRYWQKKADEPRFFYGLKNIYMPSIEDLYKMQDMGVNMYNYLLIKAGEALIIDGINHPHKGILKNAYRYLRENPDLTTMICSMYPVETVYSEIARYDTYLCDKLIEKPEDKSIYRLDNIAFFDTSPISFQKKVIDILVNELKNNPKYRFEYIPSKLLDDIFSCKFDYEMLYCTDMQLAWEKLTMLEPAYVLTSNKYLLEETNDIYRKNLLKSAMTSYLSRYNLSQFTGYNYEDKDVLTNPDTEVKRLIKCINERK